MRDGSILYFLWSKFFETRLIRHQYNALVIFQIFMYISLELKPTFFKEENSPAVHEVGTRCHLGPRTFKVISVGP